jgi:hypothetical protein
MQMAVSRHTLTGDVYDDDVIWSFFIAGIGNLETDDQDGIVFREWLSEYLIGGAASSRRQTPTRVVGPTGYNLFLFAAVRVQDRTEPPIALLAAVHGTSARHPSRMTGRRVEPQINETSGELCPWGLSPAGTGQTSRLQVAACVGLGRPVLPKGRSRVVADIQWMRTPKKMHTPMTGVAKRTSSPNAVATNRRLRGTNTNGELSEVS